ncbi:hypothetical protein [Pontibacter beigongshangensis]|uniref:hypothetical protein n=1 Tax=Pontibacter beigongshangensis TaxID=2574733 RepID=UPI00164F9714|nr:hypothetical protein [Pontibacter beigongshangensis]
MAAKEYVNYPVRLEKTLYEVAQEYCAKEEISLAALLRKFLKAHLAEKGITVD